MSEERLCFWILSGYDQKLKESKNKLAPVVNEQANDNSEFLLLNVTFDEGL